MMINEVAKMLASECTVENIYMAIWKSGENWNAELFDLNPKTDDVRTKSDLNKIEGILAEDEDAIFVNKTITVNTAVERIAIDINKAYKSYAYKLSYCKFNTGVNIF